MNKKIQYTVFLFSLFISGASGLINQIAWQRAVKIYLANSESLSSMIVVLVFMLGLGFGSMIAARKSPQLRNPFLSLGLIELALSLGNGFLLFLLGIGLQKSLYTLQIISVHYGISTRLLYALISFLILIVPCILMGLTIPVASEACQRQMKASRKSYVVHLFFANTFGAVIGTLGSGFLLLPVFGQKIALIMAATGNLIAGALILLFLSKIKGESIQETKGGDDRESTIEIPIWKRTLRTEEILALTLGFLSLGYEIYLFRIIALAYTPVPWIFSLVLCFFLLFWSFGVFISAYMRENISIILLLTSVSIASVPFILAYNRFFSIEFPLWSCGLLYFLPCFGFGLLFGQTITRYASHWGHDVGIYTALNTLGSFLGIISATLILYEMNKDYNAWIFSIGFFFLYLFFSIKEIPDFLPARGILRYLSTSITIITLIGLICFGLMQKMPVHHLHFLEFYGRDGVVEIDCHGNLCIDGLWHSSLVKDKNYISSNNWLMAIVPFLVHEGDSPKTVLVIGMGTGITGRTLAQSNSIISIDMYEINHTLKGVLLKYPLETLGEYHKDKLNILWEDARTGLLLSDRQYDIITQAPLYLKQAGSSFLLSREYLELVKSRLKEDGIFCLYCNSLGNRHQSLIVRKTLSQVFPYCESFMDSYLLLASRKPMNISVGNFQAKLKENDPLSEEICTFGIHRILEGFDHPRLEWDHCAYIITDDKPLVEYPFIINWLFR